MCPKEQYLKAKGPHHLLVQGWGSVGDYLPSVDKALVVNQVMKGRKEDFKKFYHNRELYKFYI